jgi:hypothetical protein
VGVGVGVGVTVTRESTLEAVAATAVSHAFSKSKMSDCWKNVLVKEAVKYINSREYWTPRSAFFRDASEKECLAPAVKAEVMTIMRGTRLVNHTAMLSLSLTRCRPSQH